jgi:perosamine synthetase
MATTANEDWATRMGIMSLHGISRDAWKRYARDGSWYYEIVEAGYKYNMTDIAAAIGLVQLERLDQMHQRRLAIAREYQRAFESDDAIDLLASGPDEHHAWHLFVIKLRNEALRLDRAEFVQVLKDRGIGASVHFIPLHLHPYYQSALGYRAGDAPVADSCYRRAVSLPIYSRMSDSDVGRVIDVIKGVVAEFRR